MLTTASFHFDCELFFTCKLTLQLFSYDCVCAYMHGVCVGVHVSPPFLLTNLWGFIMGFDKDCHRLERAHTRKSPMLHCGPASYAERALS